MLDTERDIALKHSNNVPEYHDIVEDLKRDLHQCKVEQSNIRSELGILQNDNQSVTDIREYFNRIHLEECSNEDLHTKEIANLQERIALLQTEKDSALQLWHISLNTIDVLEEELKGVRVNGKDIKYYQEQANTLKETYSEAIKALEGKLLQAKDNFLKQQALWQTTKEKNERLTKERDDIMQKLSKLEREAEDKDRNNQHTIETLKRELSLARGETNKMIQLKFDLEAKLSEVKRFAENVVEKDKETKSKMAEAIELIESALREKELALHREVLVLEEKTRLEQRLIAIANEYDAKIQELSKKSKDEVDNNIKGHVSEIKELKMELKEKTALLEKAERELKLAEEELGRMRRDSNAKMLDYEQKTRHMEFQLQVQDTTKAKNIYDTEIRRLNQKIAALEGKLVVSNDKLRKLEQQASSVVDGQVRHVDRKSKDVMKQYANLESHLAKTLGDKEDLVLQLKSLKHDFDHEIHKRDNERHSLENKMHEMEMNLQKANCARGDKLHDLFTENPCDAKNKRTFDITVENKCHCCQSVLSDHVNKLQDKFDKKTKELTHHVQVHQKLSKRWRDEAKSLTARFQEKTKELRSKISMLQKENHELGKELLACKQQLAQHTIRDIHRCNEANDIR